jgi:CIC family chloride channel protein
MAAFFTGVVRAPVTGIILVIEMTASMTTLLPMICACFMAMLIPALLRGPPFTNPFDETPCEHPSCNAVRRLAGHLAFSDA